MLEAYAEIDVALADLHAIPIMLPSRQREEFELAARRMQDEWANTLFYGPPAVVAAPPYWEAAACVVLVLAALASLVLPWVT